MATPTIEAPFSGSVPFSGSASYAGEAPYSGSVPVDISVGGANAAAIAAAGWQPIPVPPPPPPAPHPTPTNVPSTLVWSDEFMATALDSTRWESDGWWYNKGSTTNGGGELVSASQVTMDGQHCVLTVTKKSVKSASGVTYPYAGAMINTSTNGSTPGYQTPAPPYYIEYRALMPAAAPGWWPALWLVHNNGPYSEIDILEVVGVPGLGYATWHPASGAATSTQLNAPTLDLSKAWHTYGASVDTAGNIGWYLDGSLIGTVAAGLAATAPQMIVVNFAVGNAGSWPGAPTAATPATASLLLDYVRVFT